MYRYNRDIDGTVLSVSLNNGLSSCSIDHPDYLRWVAEGGATAEDPLWTLDARKIRRVADLYNSVSGYATSKYDDNTKARMTTYIASNATSADPTIQSKVALCESVVAWVDSLFMYYYQIKVQIIASDDPESVTWSTDQFDATDPKITLPMILQ